MEARLAKSIREANSVALGTWSVTLRPDLVRLNVSWVEVFVLYSDSVRLTLMHSPVIRETAALVQGAEYTQDAYKRVADSASVLVPASAFPAFFDTAWEAHVEAIQLASKGNLLRPGHAEGVITYLRSQGHDVPSPAMVADKAPSGLATARSLREEAESLVGAFDPKNEHDGRRWVMSALVQRQGQGKFREALLAAYGGRCAITGTAVESVLEAAHIRPYHGEHTNHVENGLLLRSDLHALFDFRLMWIQPDSLVVRIDESLKDSEYARYDGKRLKNLPADETSWPNRDCLRLRREELAAPSPPRSGK